MPESMLLDRNPRFTSGFWRHVFEPLGSKLHMSTGDHSQTNGQIKRIYRVVDLLRTDRNSQEMEQTQAARSVFSQQKCSHQ